MLYITLLIIMGILLLGWILFCAIKFIQAGKQDTINANFIGHIECEACHTQYDVPSKEFTKSSMVKQKSVTKPTFENGAMVSRPNYSYYAKKFYCPHCQKRVYGQVLNISELQKNMEPATFKTGVKWLILMAIGGFIIMACMQVPFKIEKSIRMQRVEELKQEQYEAYTK